MEKTGCLSRIFISLDTITSIEDKLRSNPNKPFTVKNFLRGLNNEIADQCGAAFSPGVIFHPELPNILIYYDQNYLGPDKAVSEFEIPAFSSATEGTVVRDLKLSYEIPEAERNALFGFRSKDISPEKMAAYNPYLISRSQEQIQKEKEEWEENHEKFLGILQEAKSSYAKENLDINKVIKLQDALKSYVKYSKPKLQQNLDMEKPRWLYQISFTVDGINGFRFGDVFNFRGMPLRNKDSYVFCIDKVTHNVDATGTWTTRIQAQSRAKGTTLF